MQEKETAIMYNELLCLDIAASHETRLAGQGSIREKILQLSGMASNGQHHLEFCHKQISVWQIKFLTLNCNIKYLRHPIFKNWHQLDLILVKRHQINEVILSRLYQNADCKSNNSLICLAET